MVELQKKKEIKNQKIYIFFLNKGLAFHLTFNFDPLIFISFFFVKLIKNRINAEIFFRP